MSKRHRQSRWILLPLMAAIFLSFACAKRQQPAPRGVLEFQVVVFDQYTDRAYPGNVNPDDQPAHVVASSMVPVEAPAAHEHIQSIQDGLAIALRWDRVRPANDPKLGQMEFENFQWELKNPVNANGAIYPQNKASMEHFSIGHNFKLLQGPSKLNHGSASDAWVKKAEWAVRVRWQPVQQAHKTIDVAESYRQALATGHQQKGS